MLHFPAQQYLSDLVDIGLIETAPSLMTVPERLLLSALALGRQPNRILEIGTAYGGTALLLDSTLARAGTPHTIVCLDPSPHESFIPTANIQLVIGRSPVSLPECAKKVIGKFDWVIVDGDHALQAVIDDICGVLPYLRRGGWVICHDAHAPSVQRGIHSALSHFSSSFFDLGLMTKEPWVIDGQAWGGLQILVASR